MANALAVEGRFTATNFLKTLVDNQQLSYKFSVHSDSPHRQRVRVTFSKPTPAMPSPAAVAHLYFHLDDRLQQVLGFTVESETHFHSLADERFNESILDLVIRRKLALRAQHLVDLSDDFSSTRVPEIMAERNERQRDLNREALEEFLLERFQRKDPYNDGRISFADFKDVVYGLELGAVRRRDREILFAFVELDRNDMVDYGALVGIAADVVDTLQQVMRSEDEKSRRGREGSDDSDGGAQRCPRVGGDGRVVQHCFKAPTVSHDRSPVGVAGDAAASDAIACRAQGQQGRRVGRS
ncbi:hypothetical protein PINS_up001743 [Pythium insidiosum]|nr:hypothetical protein PINS_up001743 [Pythium insidiosum]